MKESILKNRDSRLEMLRIFSMILICFSHCVQHIGNNNWEILERPLSFMWITNLLLGSWGQVGVSVFVIISAWFLTEQNEIHIRGIWNIIGQTWLESVLVLILVSISKFEVVSGKIIIKELLTPVYGQYWFVTTYCVFYMLTPILRIILKGISQKQLKLICIAGSFICPVYTMIFGGNEILGGSLMDFCYVFFLTAYLKQKQGNWLERHCFLGVIIGSGCIIVGSIGIKLIFGTQAISKILKLITCRNCFVYIIAFCLFYLYQKLKYHNHKFINKLAKGTLGIYILHENILMRGDNGKSLLWEKIWHISNYYNYPGGYIIHLVSAVIITFFICWVIAMICEIFSGWILKKMEWIDRFCAMVKRRYLS